MGHHFSRCKKAKNDESKSVCDSIKRTPLKTAIKMMGELHNNHRSDEKPLSKVDERNETSASAERSLKSSENEELQEQQDVKAEEDDIKLECHAHSLDVEKLFPDFDFKLSLSLKSFGFSGFGQADEDDEATVSAERSQQSLKIQSPVDQDDQDEQDVKDCHEKVEEDIQLECHAHSPDVENHLQEFDFNISLSLKSFDSPVSAECSQHSLKIQSSEDEEDQNESEVKEPVRESTKDMKKRLTVKTDDVFRHYKVGRQLGKGSYGCVYEAERLSDGLQVALKFITKTTNMKLLRVSGYRKHLPEEVAIMIMMQKGGSIPEIIKLLEWFDEAERYILVLERPKNCQDLSSYLERHGGHVDEQKALVIMRQVVKAVQECRKKGVFHRDIKLENLLVNTKTLQVKMIDFGCSVVLKKGYYKQITGTEAYLPPEVYIEGKYRGNPATVWSLGLLIFRMMVGRFPFVIELHRIYEEDWSYPDISQHLKEFMYACLKHKEKKRISLKKIHKHIWIQDMP